LQVGEIFERVAMDFVGPLPKTRRGNVYIIVATEALTRWPLAVAVPKANSTTVAKFLYNDIVLQFGAPATLLTDRGTHFFNRVVEKLTTMMQIRHVKTTWYHPQTNGLTERFNGTLCKALAKCAEDIGDDWDEFIPAVLFAYRVRTQTTSKHSPFFLMYGVEARVPPVIEKFHEQFVPRDEQLIELQQERKKLHRKRQTKTSRFRVGDHVWIKKVATGNKLEPRFAGPLQIQAVGPNDTYRVVDANGYEYETMVAGDRLKKRTTEHTSDRPAVPNKGGGAVVPIVN
jgi:hypothetical protein